MYSKLHDKQAVQFVGIESEVGQSIIATFQDDLQQITHKFFENSPKSISSKDSSSRMMYWDSISYLPDDILCKVDRAAMGNSLETRVPFLDHRIAELAQKIPSHMKIQNGIGKSILRNILYKYVPKELIERPKAGFGIPLGLWLRGPLKNWVEDLLNPVRLEKEGFLNAEIVNKIWKEHLSGKRDWSFRVWSIVIFQQWLESQNLY